jgi:hypothetical protein
MFLIKDAKIQKISFLTPAKQVFIQGKRILILESDAKKRFKDLKI